jgi:hypothetical protein
VLHSSILSSGRQRFLTNFEGCAKEGKMPGIQKIINYYLFIHNSRQIVLDERRLCLSTVSAANNLFPPVRG